MQSPPQPKHASKKYVLLRQMASLVAKSTYTPRRRKKRAWLYQTHQSCPCPLIHGGIDAVEPPREVCASLRPRLTLCTLRRYLSRLRVRGTARVAGMCVNGALQLAFCCTSTSCEHHSGGVSFGRRWEACIRSFLVCRTDSDSMKMVVRGEKACKNTVTTLHSVQVQFCNRLFRHDP